MPVGPLPHLEWEVEPLLDVHPIGLVLLRVVAVGAAKAEDLVHTAGLQRDNIVHDHH